MYQHNFKSWNALFRIDHDWYFEGRYVCFTMINCEYDKDILSTSLSIGILGIHFTLVWND